MVDKKYCMSSYMAFRYIEKDNRDFYEGIYHENFKAIPLEERIPVRTASDIDIGLTKEFAKLRNKKMGILLSGGMDSAICASYMSGCNAYTFRFLDGEYQSEELKRAEYYADYYGLKLHYVDIDWNTVMKYIDDVMKSKAAPVHSIEPQIMQAALQAKSDGVELIIIGESSDLIFGGMDQLLSKDWLFEDFIKRYTFLNPEEVLVDGQCMRYLYEKYRIKDNKINFLKFLNEVYSIESAGSYLNAFKAAKMQYFDPYAKFIMSEEMDLERIRKGESKYLIRELMARKYPEISVPEKVPMPRPVDFYFKNWGGPKRPEFRKDIEIDKYSGNQKWQMWCLERFLDMYEPIQENR